MIQKLAHSTKIKKYLSLMIVLSFLVLIMCLIYPISQKARIVQIIGDKTLTISKTLSTTISHLSPTDLDNIRSNPSSTTQTYKNINGLFTTVAQNLNCTRIFAVYKGVGGKYYYLLDSLYRDNVNENLYANPGDPISNEYLKHKSILDKISDEKISEQYGTSILDTQYGKGIIGWSSLTNKKGDIVAILAVQSDPGNTDFNKFGPLDLNILAIISFLLLAFSLGTIIIFQNIIRKNKIKAKQNPNTNNTTTLSKLSQEILNNDKEEELPPQDVDKQ